MLRAWIYDFIPSLLVREMEDYSDFEETISSTKPTIINFYSSWAFSCRRFEPELNRLSRMLSNIQFRTLNCENMAKLCDDLKIHVYPSLRLYSGDNNSIDRGSYKRGVHIPLPDLDDVDDLDLNALAQSIQTISAQERLSLHSIKTEL